MMQTPGKEWLIEDPSYSPDKELYWETIYALSNGYMAARGTLEENHFCPDIRSYFGTYVAGIFDKYAGDYQAIVNVADFFNTVIYLNGGQVDMTRESIEDYARYLDMYNGVLVRRFLWSDPEGQKTKIEITRFISKADPHLAVQRYRIKPLNYDGEAAITSVLDGNVTNIDFHISGYQLRDEKYYFIADEHQAIDLENGAGLILNTKTTEHSICELFRYALLEDGKPIEPNVVAEMTARQIQNCASFAVAEGKEYTFFKVIAVYTSNDVDEVPDLKQAAEKKASEALKAGYEKLLEAHAARWNEHWEASDITIEGDERDQRNVRFNVFHLIQMGNKDNPYVNVGSRGLTSEMHYGNSFWDTEIFILPFFIYTDPDAARALARYRYETLPEAREKAHRLLFKGAMFPWMSSFPGKEQADYWEYANIAVHIVCDVAYGLMHYFNATRDADFMLDHGLEVLIETARFWTSRVDYSESKQAYVLNVVKGPNEYGIVNNNTYTNWGARWNLQQAKAMVGWAKEQHPDRLDALAEKIGFHAAETDQWSHVADHMYIHHDESRNLYVEDDMILDKRPIDLKTLKPGKKITTELGFAWDTLLFHRIVKQADVLLMMYLHRSEFTLGHLKNAWDFYEPITLHDSSLSYNTHSIVANELGLREQSEEYFQQTARLDLEDVMENVFLGIHAANAGGTWQCVINGFAGMRLAGNRLEFSPNLPKRWKKLRFRVFFRGNLFRIEIADNQPQIAHERGEGEPFRIEHNAIICEPS